MDRNSPLLEEIQHEPLSEDNWAGEAFWLPKEPRLYANLRILKMVPSRTISQRISLNIPPRSQSLSIFFRAFRLQLRVLHFDAPHPGILEDIQCLMLRELRIDISVAVSGKAEFDCLGKMNLEVLEFSGQTDVFQFLPSMMTLRELYLPIDKGTFSRTTLNDIATRTPDLKKLVLRFEYGLSLALSAVSDHFQPLC
ncbi:hypothetical protein DL96DRAFT_1641335, partial [Flagelloscypha sp. PMI_526]